VIIISLLSNVVTFNHTATDNNKFNLTTSDFWVREANIHIVTNDAKYGDENNQDASIAAGGILSFQDFNLKDLFFKNATGGSNTTIQCIAIKMTDKYKQSLGD